MSTKTAYGVAPAVSLADYTSEQFIMPELRQRDFPGVIQELSRALQEGSVISDILPFYQAVLNRELLGSTALDFGMAFPHARMRCLTQLCFAFGRCADPIAWGPTGSPGVEWVFLLAVPATESANYLYLISGLAGLRKQDHWLKVLHYSKTPREMYSVLRQIPVRCGPRTTA